MLKSLPVGYRSSKSLAVLNIVQTKRMFQEIFMTFRNGTRSRSLNELKGNRDNFIKGSTGVD